MKALVFERYAAPVRRRPGGRRASCPAGARRRARCGWRDVDPPELPGAGWVRVRPRLAGICGSDLATSTAAVVALLRADRVVPVRARPRGRGRARRRHPGRARAGARLRRPGHRPAVRRLRRRRRRPLRAASPSATSSPACRPVLRRHRRRLVDRAGRPREPAPPRARRHERRGRGDGRARRLRRPRRPGRAATGGVSVVLGAGTLGLLHRSPPCARFGTPRHADRRRQAPRPAAPGHASSGADVVVDPGEAAPGRAPGHRRRWRSATRLTGGADAVVDCVGSDDTIAAGARRGPRRRAGRARAACPARCRLDLTPLWHREVALVGAYAYGTGGRRPAHLRPRLRAGPGGRPRPAGVGHLSPRPLPGRHRARRRRRRRGAVKIAFDLRNERERESL